MRDVVDQITVNRAEATSGALTNLDERAANAGENIADKTKEVAKDTVNKTEELAKETADKTESVAHKTAVVAEDAAITSAVKTKMLADPMVKGLKIDVDTRDAVVTLNGDVASKAEMDKAITIARNTKGVTRVISNLHVK